MGFRIIYGVLCLSEQHRQPLLVLFVLLRSQLSSGRGLFGRTLLGHKHALSCAFVFLSSLKSLIDHIHFHDTPLGWAVIYTFRSSYCDCVWWLTADMFDQSVSSAVSLARHSCAALCSYSTYIYAQWRTRNSKSSGTDHSAASRGHRGLSFANTKQHFFNVLGSPTASSDVPQWPSCIMGIVGAMFWKSWRMQGIKAISLVMLYQLCF